LEVRPFILKNSLENLDDGLPESIEFQNHIIDIFISGIGLVFPSYKLTKLLNIISYDLIINIGIAGSFTRNLNIGDVVLVEQEEFGDLGIDDSDGFQTVFEKGFLDKDEFPFTDGKLICPNIDIFENFGLTKVRSLSSNTAHGNQNKINQLIQKFNPEIESMEGASFFYVCLMEKVDFLEIRGISNYVETRNEKNWDIPLALENLSNELKRIIGNL